MNPLVIILIALIIIPTVFQIYHSIQTKKISDDLVNLATKQKFAELYKRIEDPKTQKYVPQFNLQYLAMNAGILENNPDIARKYFDSLSDCIMNEAQVKAVYTRGLQYFITLSDKNRCKICYEKLRQAKMDPATARYLDHIYDVMILDKADCLNDLLEEIKGKTTPDIFANEFLIANIYKNIGDAEKEKEYQVLAQEHMEEFLRNQQSGSK